MTTSDDGVFWQDLVRIVQMTAAAVFGIAGLFGAKDASDGIGHACGLGLFAASVLLIFWIMKRWADGAPAVRLRDLLVDNFIALAIVVPLLAALGVAGLFVAAASGGGTGDYFGLGLAVAAWSLAFLNMKACWDAEDTRHPI